MRLNPTDPAVRGFRSLIPPGRWRDLVRSGRARTFESGDSLLEQGTRSLTVYALVECRVQVVYAEEDGSEFLLAIRGPGDLVGEYSQRDRREHMASVRALERCTAAALGAAAFDAFIRGSGLNEPLEHYILGKTRQGGSRVWRAANLPTEQRMAQLFLEVIAAASDPGEATVPMSQGQIAESLGTSLRSINLLLAQWRRLAIVRTRPGPITVLDHRALARRANRN